MAVSKRLYLLLLTISSRPGSGHLHHVALVQEAVRLDQQQLAYEALKEAQNDEADATDEEEASLESEEAQAEAEEEEYSESELEAFTAENEVAQAFSWGPGYGFDKYYKGEIVEGKGKGSTWVPVLITGEHDGLYNLLVLDDKPSQSQEVPSVPPYMLRRALQPGQADFLVDNSELQARGLGIRFRHSKNIKDRSGEYMHWETQVVGFDEGDGWLKTARGYLPMTFRGKRVLTKQNRTEPLVVPEGFQLHLQGLEERMKAGVLPKVAKKSKKAAAKRLGPFTVGEEAEFRTQGGKWYPCRITGLGAHPDTYNVAVKPNDFSDYPRTNILASRLRKLNSLPSFESKDILVRNDEGTELAIHVSGTSKLEMLMKSACNKLKISWHDCRSNFTFSHGVQRGHSRHFEELSPTTHLSDSGLEDDDVVFMNRTASKPTETGRVPTEQALANSSLSNGSQETMLVTANESTSRVNESSLVNEASLVNINSSSATTEKLANDSAGALGGASANGSGIAEPQGGGTENQSRSLAGRSAAAAVSVARASTWSSPHPPHKAHNTGAFSLGASAKQRTASQHRRVPASAQKPYKPHKPWTSYKPHNQRAP